MLKLHIDNREYYDPDTNTFCEVEETDILLEHTLKAVSDWESETKRSFFLEHDRGFTVDDFRLYMCCMVVGEVSDEIYTYLRRYSTMDCIQKGFAYIEDPRSASAVTNDGPKKARTSVMTSELLYCRMTEHNIPFTAETWNLNRLLKLIEICVAEHSPKRKKSKEETLNDYKRANARRRPPKH